LKLNAGFPETGRFWGVWAQVAERLMAADCKSATHSSYGGSNPPLCTMKQLSEISGQ
jgi:hypothetical protein